MQSQCLKLENSQMNRWTVFLESLRRQVLKILIIAIIFLLFIGIDKIFWSRKRGGASSKVLGRYQVVLYQRIIFSRENERGLFQPNNSPLLWPLPSLSPIIPNDIYDRVFTVLLGG